jgi:hypothetical protein
MKWLSGTSNRGRFRPCIQERYGLARFSWLSCRKIIKAAKACSAIYLLKKGVRQIMQNTPVNDIGTVPDRDKSGFKDGIWKKITLPAQTKIFRLDNKDAEESEDWKVVSPWWSFVDPCMEDKEGAKGRYEQAVLNGLDMSCMVRYMSAVKLEWNDLNNYVEVRTCCELTAFWGQFAPMSLSNLDKAKYLNKLTLLQSQDADYSSMSDTFFGKKIRPAKLSSWEKVFAASMPRRWEAQYSGGLMGFLEGWQLYIPNLKNDYLAAKGGRPKIFDARTQMNALGEHLQSTLKPSVRRFPRMIKAQYFLNQFGVAELSKDPRLMKMKDTLLKIDSLDPSSNPFPARVSPAIANELRTFVIYADLICKSGTVANNIKEDIKEDGLLAKSFLSGQDEEQVKHLLV